MAAYHASYGGFQPPVRCSPLRDELFGDSDVNAVSKVTTKMVQNGFLRSHPLDEKRKYWTFGPEACALFGVPPQKANPLGPQALVDELGTLLFCLGGPTRRKRLTVARCSLDGAAACSRA